MRIVEFKAENIARIKAVEITPDTGKNIVALTGKNRQGKTTILNAIWMALGGKDAIPSRPIRNGASDASVFLDMGEFTVTRRFTESGNSHLVVKHKDGFEARSPQAFLSSRLGGRAQNPLEFMRLKPEDQVKALQKMIDIKLDREELARVSGILIAGIKCDDPIQLIDATYKHLFEQRTLVNAEVSRLDGAVKTAKKQIPPGKENTEKVSVAELFGERKAFEEVQTSKEVLKKDIDVRTLLRQDWTKESRRIGEEIKEYERRVTLLQERMREITELHDRAGEAIDKLTQSHAAIADPDFTDIDARIAAADETNRLAILIDQLIKSAADLAEQKTKSSGMTERLQAIKDYKGRLIVEAGLPVEGLGFEAGEVTFNGIPLGQASTAEQIQISCAICMSSHPEIGVLSIDVGWNELDSEGKAALTAWATANDCQVWITRVTEDADSDGFHIFDGEVVAVNGVGVPPSEGAESAVLDTVVAPSVDDSIPF